MIDSMLINRCVLVVRPKQPYADWANSFNDGGPGYDLKEQRQEPHAYLVFDHADTGDPQAMIDSYWEDLFEQELNAWMRDPKTWPQKRTLAMFRQWFDIDFAPIVVDLVEDEPLET